MFMIWIWYIFAAFVVWQGWQSLRGGFGFLRYVRDELSKPPSNYAPFASVIAPCRGVDQGLRQNLAALFEQDYPAYEIIFVTGDANDPACAFIEEARREAEKNHSRASAANFLQSRVVIAGRARGRSQKIHNLLAAIRETDARSEVFVFVDTDARPSSGWLRALVAPLADERVGAATGYRWFFPVRNAFPSHLRAAWNASIASALGADGRKNFCWGGSTAIRRETFERVRVADAWRGALSDDFALMRALHEADLPIHFVPQVLAASHEDCTLLELFEFTTRQMKITRVYAEHFWKLSLVGTLLFTSVFCVGVAILITRAALEQNFIAPLVFIALMFILGAGKALLRLRAVRLIFGERFPRGFSLVVTYAAQLTLWLVSAPLFAYNALAAACSRRILWRGIRYELKSPTETIIIGKDDSEMTSHESDSELSAEV